MLLLVGQGRFGKILYEKLKGLGDVEVVTREWRRHLTDKKWVLIATPVATHAEIARECLEHGINVFCEKPLDEDPRVVAELIALAQEKKVRLYIDDVFLWREEYKKIRSINTAPHHIIFRMTKYGTFDDSLLVAHIYHDLYLISDLTHFAPITDLKIIKTASPLKAGRIDILEFSFRAGDTLVEASYDRTQERKEKTITIDETIIWKDNSLTIDGSPETLPPHDALTDILMMVLAEKVNFTYNNKLALAATNLLSSINGLIPTI